MSTKTNGFGVVIRVASIGASIFKWDAAVRQPTPRVAAGCQTGPPQALPSLDRPTDSGRGLSPDGPPMAGSHPARPAEPEGQSHPITPTQNSFVPGWNAFAPAQNTIASGQNCSAPAQRSFEPGQNFSASGQNHAAPAQNSFA